MARKSALPQGALDKLIDEVQRENRVKREPAVTASSRSRTTSRPPRATPRGTRAGTGRIGGRAPATPVRIAGGSSAGRGDNPFRRDHDAIVRWAASRGISMGGGPVETVRLLLRLSADVREVARRERVSSLTIVSRALASYITRAEDA